MRIRTFLLIVVLAPFLIFIACRKVDHQPSQHSSVNQQSKFFDNHRSPDPLEKALVDFIRRENEKKNFVEGTIKKIGFPYWDKAIKKATNAHKHGRIESDSAYVVYVPFVRDSQNYVNASMAIYVDQEDTTYSFLCDWQYSGLHNTPTINDTAEHYAVFFMMLDKAVFGHRRFSVTDSSLFQVNDHRAYFLTFKSNSSSTGRNNLVTPITVCDDVTVYYFVQCPYPDTEECENGCDHCILCMDSYSYEYCWEEYIYSTGGGGSGGGEGGGSGGGSGGEPPPCPGENPYRIEDVTDPCEPGWIPTGDDPNLEYPNNKCKVIDSLLNTTAFPQHLQTLRDSTVANHEIGFSFTLPDNSSTTHSYHAGDSNLAVNVNVTGTVDGIMHNHNNSPGRLTIFSAEDLMALAQYFVKNEIRDVRTFTYTLVTDSTAYIIMIDDPDKFLKFVMRWLSTTQNMRNFGDYFYEGFEVGAPGLSVAQREKNFLQCMKRAMEFDQQDGIGIKLFRGNANMTAFSPIKLAANGSVKGDSCN